MGTDKLFLEDAYLTNFKGKIIEVQDSNIILDRTIFYPESGGQLGDTGILLLNDQTFKVENTRQFKDRILHILDSKEDLSSVEIFTEIEGQINWNRRFTLMRSHTAQHVISRYFQIKFGAETVSTQLKLDESRLDFAPIDKITSNELEVITSEINKILSSNLNVRISYLPREEAISFLQQKDYQIQYLKMVPKTVKNFRIVSIGDYDFAACGGTHVRNTAEIKKIRLVRTKNKGKSRERIFYSIETSID